jgi:hypothetical protein
MADAMTCGGPWIRARTSSTSWCRVIAPRGRSRGASNAAHGLPDLPRVIIKGQRKRAAATGEVMPGVEHRQRRSLKNRCEHLHRPTRARERRTQRFKSPGRCRRLLSASSPNTSARTGIGFLPWLTGRQCDTDSIHGRKSQPFPLQLKDSRLRPSRTCLPDAHVDRK